MITGNNDRWSALSMKEKADLFKLYAAEGISSLDKIRQHYNSLGRPNPSNTPSVQEQHTEVSSREFRDGGIVGGIKKLFAPSYEGSFKEAFRQARANGDSYFKWNGARYSTEMKPTEYVKDENLSIQGVTAKQKELMDYTWDYLRSHNVSARNAAALMGNIMKESSFSPDVIQRGGDNAVGLFQLHGKRLADYKKYLAEEKLQNNTPNQINYVLEVIKGNRGDYYIDDYNRVTGEIAKLGQKEKLANWEKNALKEYQKYYNDNFKVRAETGTLYPISGLTEAFENESMSLEDFSDMFTNTFERAGKPEFDKRHSYANSFYNYYYGVPTVVE